MTDYQIFGGKKPSVEKRKLWPALKNGIKCKCPNCQKGKLFKGFAKSIDICDICGEEIFHHRADDLPAYLNLFVVGHIVVGLYILTDSYYEISPWLEVSIWTLLAVIMTLLLLQPIKGFVIALQWANRMHGFSGNDEDGTLDTNTDPTHYG